MTDQEMNSLILEHIFKGKTPEADFLYNWNDFKHFVDLIRESGRYCCITMYSDFHYCWKVELIRYMPNDHSQKTWADGYNSLLKAFAVCVLGDMGLLEKGFRSTVVHSKDKQLPGEFINSEKH